MSQEREIDIRKEIFVKNAHLNNLKNIDVRIPKNKLVVITGVSGSGKSSLAFDTARQTRRRHRAFGIGQVLARF